MTDSELQDLTLATAIRAIVEKKISAEELLDAVMSRIERLNPEMRAFITVIKPEQAGGHRPPLQGIPISVKDLYDTKGVRTTAGSKIFENRVPDEDADAVKQLRDAGAVIVGK